MGFKKMETNLSFADISLFSSLEHNRAIKRMEQINAVVNWSQIEMLVMRHYPVGKSSVLHASIQNCFQCIEYYHILPEYLRIDAYS